MSETENKDNEYNLKQIFKKLEYVNKKYNPNCPLCGCVIYDKIA